MNKCPCCGYNFKKQYNIAIEIRDMMSVRNNKTRRYLNKISSLITNNVPSETRLNYFQFLFALKDIDDEIINWAIEKFYQSKHYLHGKGFAYLRSIIQNRNKNIDKMAENERKLLGSIPPVIKE